MAKDGRNTEGAGNDLGAEYASTLCVGDDWKVHIVENNGKTRDS